MHVVKDSDKADVIIIALDPNNFAILAWLSRVKALAAINMMCWAAPLEPRDVFADTGRCA